MGKQRFTYLQRYALWRAYDMKCFYCGLPLRFMDMTIDHVVPECLRDNPAELQRVVDEYEIDKNFPDFCISDYSNWVASCGSNCNRRKRQTLLPKRLTLLYLSEVQRRLQKVVRELERLCQNRKQDKILADIATELERNAITVSNLHELIEKLEFEQTRDQPLVITLGLSTEGIVVGGELPNDVSVYYPHLCDWLENDLDRRLRSLLPYSFHQTEASARDGETLSVRLVFPELSLDEIDKLNLGEIETSLPWWKILEVTNFYQVYGAPYKG